MSSEDDVPTVKRLMRHKVAELKAMLAEAGVKAQGKKVCCVLLA